MKRKNEKDNEGQDPKQDSKKKTTKRYNALNKQNAPIEIFINREMIKFDAHGLNPVYPKRYSAGIPAETIEHPDFKSVSKYFSVTEKK